MQSLNFPHSAWLKIFWLEAGLVEHLVKFVLFGSATFLLASLLTLKIVIFGWNSAHMDEVIH